MTLLVDDRQLLDAFRAGDRAALDTVYRHYVADIAALVRRGFSIASREIRIPGAGDPASERDVVQDVFVRAFAAAARLAYDGLRPYRPYLRRIAMNLLVDRVRARAQAGSVISIDDVPELAEPTPESPDDHHDPALTALTATYVASLSAEAQALVQRRFEDGLSQQQVAEALGISRRRVRTLEARVQTGLRKALRRAGLA